ncbi:MAG TPA: hypothetical protein VN428_25270 [Bryobacteraceae bacterium]|nr:hypothetical protein [Bryobacteraceae bacterium]
MAERLGGRLILEEYGKTALGAIAKRTPNTVHGIAANVWNRIVFKRWNSVDPQQLAPYFRQSDPTLHLAISDVIGNEVIRDIYYVRGWKGSKKPSRLAVELLVAHVYRNDLQLGDVTFRNPDQPIPPAARRFSDQTHRGFGLLPILMENLIKKAREHHCEQVTLTAARRDQVPMFGHHGFRVEDTASGQAAMRLGYGIPMERDVEAFRA